MRVAVMRVIIGQYFYAGKKIIVRVSPTQCGWDHISVIVGYWI